MFVGYMVAIRSKLQGKSEKRIGTSSSSLPLRISSDGGDPRIFWGLKFSFPGFC